MGRTRGFRLIAGRCRQEGKQEDIYAELDFTPAQVSGRDPDIEYGARDRNDEDQDDDPGGG